MTSVEDEDTGKEAQQMDEIALTIENAARVGLVPAEWCPGGNRCMKSTNGKTGRCWNRARWCDTEAAARYDRYDFKHREAGSYAYKVCNTHALKMLTEAQRDG